MHCAAEVELTVAVTVRLYKTYVCDQPSGEQPPYTSRKGRLIWLISLPTQIMNRIGLSHLAHTATTPGNCFKAMNANLQSYLCKAACNKTRPIAVVEHTAARYLILSVTAHHILSILATSVPHKGMFSMASIIVNDLSFSECTYLSQQKFWPVNCTACAHCVAMHARSTFIQVPTSAGLITWVVVKQVLYSHQMQQYRDIVMEFLANMNSRSRFLFAVARPSVVCLSSVCNARAPYSGGSNFQ